MNFLHFMILVRTYASAVIMVIRPILTAFVWVQAVKVRVRDAVVGDVKQDGANDRADDPDSLCCACRSL